MWFFFLKTTAMLILVIGDTIVGTIKRGSFLPTSPGTHTTIIALRLTPSVEALVVHRRRKAALGCCLRAFPVVTPVLPQLFAFCIGQLSCALCSGGEVEE